MAARRKKQPAMTHWPAPVRRLGWERKDGSSEYTGETIRFGVTCKHIAFPGEWIMWCYALDMREFRLPNAKNLSDAELDAMSVIARRLYVIKAELGNAMDAQPAKEPKP